MSYPSNGGGDGALSVPSDQIFENTSARDAYFVTNPGKLIEGAQCVVLTSPPSGLYQVYKSNEWVDHSAVVVGPRGEKGDKGDKGESGLSSLDSGQVGVKSQTGDELVYSGASVNPATGQWVFDRTIEVPSSSLDVGDVVTISEGSTELLISNNVDGVVSSVISSDIDSTGAKRPSYFNFGEEKSFIPQPYDSEVITTNPLIASSVGRVVSPDVRQINQTIFRADQSMPNTVAEIKDKASGKVIKYIPSRAAWEADTEEDKARNPGLNLIPGDNVINYISRQEDTPGIFNIGVSPFRLKEGQEFEIIIKADVMALKGISGVPYLAEVVQDGPEVSLLDSSDAVSVDGINSSNIKTGIGLESLDNGDGTVTIKTSGQVDVIDLDVDVDSTVTLDKTFVGKLCSIVQTLSVTPIPMVITLSDHGEFENGDTINIGTDASYKNYFYVVYYNDSQGAILVAYPSRLQGVRLVRTLEGWDVGIDGKYSKVAIRPEAKAGIPFEGNDTDVKPVQAFSFIDHPAVNFVEDKIVVSEFAPTEEKIEALADAI
ncbi:MAG: hypothetical protein V7765_21085, partial [Oleispira sp.]